MPNILLLEDDLQLHETIKEYLELKGFKIFSAYDGEMAEDIFYEVSIDLVLLDVKVPKVDGFGVLEYINSSNKDVPVIFITSLNSIDNVEKGFNLGCVDYIKKPFALKELLIRVNANIKSNDSIEIEKGLVFDTKSLRIAKDGVKIDLKTKELKLLKLFLENRNELLDYDRIYSEIWDFDQEPSSASLRTYIKNLRKVVGKEKIETVKNIGYRFVSK